jgi:phospholipase A1
MSVYKILWFIFLVAVLPLSSNAQSGMSEDSTEFIFSHAPAFSIYKDNYFVVGTTIGETPSKANTDAKFQFSFKQRLLNKPLIAGAYFYLTYTQKSFWNILQKSSPFAETNYKPGLQLIKPVYVNNRLSGVVGLSLEHESNGLDSIFSRSWNYAALTYSYIFSAKVFASLKLFLPFALSDNPSLPAYAGLSETQVTWNIITNKLILDAVGRKGRGWNTKGNLLTGISFRPLQRDNLYLTLQWFQGYAESLMDYMESTSKLRIGVIIKPTLLRFY